ncbi:MAG TPA: methyltransferase domain-containing protein [Candidatus Acidoferrum sp.]|nr:methyltransferase domain-containing protein [Candidatus Acidoferrum sp.]
MRSPNLNGARKRYARKIQRKAHLHSKLLVSAFAVTPREHYLGPPPWKILTLKGYRSPRKPHPRHLYDDVLVGILPERFLNNGQPSGLAMWFDALNLKRNERLVHIGCGTGYYTAILANVVGPGGCVRAFEIDPELAARASSNLAHLRHVEVTHGDGSALDPGPADAIFVNAGANYPAPIWLDAIPVKGRLMFPLISTGNIRHPSVAPWRARRSPSFHSFGMGGMMLLVSRNTSHLSVKVISSVGIFPCIGGIEREADKRAASSLERTDYDSITTLRRDPHNQDESCWLHGEDFCFSTN